MRCKLSATWPRLLSNTGSSATRAKSDASICRRVTGDRLPAITRTGPCAAPIHAVPADAATVPVSCQCAHSACVTPLGPATTIRRSCASRQMIRPTGARSAARVTSNSSAFPSRAARDGVIELRQLIGGIRHRHDAGEPEPLEVQPQVQLGHRRDRMTRHRMAVDAQHRPAGLRGGEQVTERAIAPDVRLPAHDRDEAAGHAFGQDAQRHRDVPGAG